ncbi:LacI family DNA-binding transcriptional regulator [Cohnella yongneupensis]|uniref:LacI family DNA-binding transcriptional regulator n=1 Tax=Cohnella yongneupensis TaxID=425006 RepID=A0ABW0QXP9_9BACL
MNNNGINATEIARLAGVSRSTVSRVINNYANVPPETRRKVMEIIRRHRYVPNMSAQVLAGKKTKTIGLFMIEKGHVSADIISNMLLASVIESASMHGYYVLTHIIRGNCDSDSISGVKDIFYQRRIDGGLFIGATNDEPFIEELVAEGFWVATVDQSFEGREEPNRMVADLNNETGMRLAVSHLAELNHREIGHVSGDLNRYSGPAKLEGFRKAMAHCGLTVREDWIMPGGFHETNGYDAIRTFLASGKRLPTAIVMANDSVAFGAIRALKEHGIEVPRDISIIGFDDHALSARFQPPLTTLRVDFAGVLEQLTTSLIQHIEQKAFGAEKFTASTQFITRDSCQSI